MTVPKIRDAGSDRARPARARGLRVVSGALAMLLGVASAQTPPPPPPPAVAAPWPTHPVTLVVPFAGGGPSDIIGRALAVALNKQLGQDVQVDNITGSAGMNGAERVRQAAPDGYTLLMHHMALAAAPALHRRLGFDPATELAPIALVAEVPMTLVARPDLLPASGEPWTALRTLPRRPSLAHAGVGSPSFLCAVLLSQAIGGEFALAAFPSSADAMTALLGRKTDLLCDLSSSTTGQVQARTVRALAVTTATRAPNLPQVPTLQETGIARVDLSAWHALFAPVGTPPETRERIRAGLLAAVRDPDFAFKMREMGVVVPVAEHMDAGTAVARLRGDIARWTPVIQRARVTVD